MDLCALREILPSAIRKERCSTFQAGRSSAFAGAGTRETSLSAMALTGKWVLNLRSRLACCPRRSPNRQAHNAAGWIVRALRGLPATASRGLMVVAHDGRPRSQQFTHRPSLRDAPVGRKWRVAVENFTGCTEAMRPQMMSHRLEE